MILHSKIYGEGPALIILHGLLGSLDNWQSIAKYFGQKYQVITLDARNHGRSEHIETFSYEVMMNDVIETMDSLAITKANFIGHSMGGKTAMYLALNHPNRVDKLAVVDIAPVKYKPHHEDVFNALNAVPIDKIEQRNDAESIIKEYIQEYDVVQFLMKGLYRKEDNSFAWRYNVKDIYPSYDNIIGFDITDKLFEGKTLFLRGANSNYILDKDWDIIHGFFPNAKIETIADAGHWLHAEKPKEFIQAMEYFLV